jgi:hypothetical protein
MLIPPQHIYNITANSDAVPLTDALPMASAISGEIAAASIIPPYVSRHSAFQHRELSHPPKSSMVPLKLIHWI